MRLKSLELHGFKSFPEKTKLTFDEGATVIVGPNGSGKSNITDAMRWVLGELSSKNIRGSKMEDVIFMGAEGFRPMGFAEVSVTFDNTDPESRIDSPYDEITVTRRYYRAGESEYYINRKAVRLRDIHELFMNTGIGREGYSIIGQGKIAEIVSQKSEDRRGIFEETAGIAKYRFKKQEAQKKLDAAEANMLRIADILSELESRVGPLERQSRKAREYLALFEQKKEIDVALWLYDMARMQQDEIKTKNDCAASRQELEITQDTADQLQAQSDRLFSVSQDNKQEAAKVYETIREGTTQAHAAQNAYRMLENDAAHATAELAAQRVVEERLIADLNEQKASLARYTEEYAEIERLLAAAEEELHCAAEAYAALQTRIAEKDNVLEEQLAELKKHEDVFLDLKVRRDVLMNTISSQNDRFDDLRDEIAKYETEHSDILKEAETLTASVADYTEAIAKAEADSAEAERRVSVFREDESTLLREGGAVAASAQALDSRIAALQNMMEHFDGYNNSVRHVMNESRAGKLVGIHGPVSHLITVKQEYTVALETALGAALQNIVVDDERAAKSAIESLKRSGTGRATFYPISSMKASPRGRDTEAAAGYEGFVGFADDLIRSDEKYGGILGSLLNRIAVFDTLDHATVMAKSQGWRVRAVTLDGQQINAGGSFTGGAVRRDSGMLTRGAQIETLRTERERIAEKKSALDDQLKQVRERIASELQGIASVSDRVRMLRTLMQADQMQLDELTARRGVIENLMNQFREDETKLRQLGERGDADIRALEDDCRRESDEMERIAEKRRAVDMERAAIADEAEAKQEEIQQLRIRQAEIRKDQEAKTLLILQTNSEMERLRADQAANLTKQREITESLAELRETMCAKKEEADALQQSLTSLEETRASLEAGAMEFERKLNELRLRLKDVTAKRELLIEAHSKNESKYQQLCADIDKMTQRLWDEYELTPSTAAELSYPSVETESRAAFTLRLQELKGQIKALGHVNVASIDEYVEVKERYDFVSLQMEDLTASRADLDGIVREIEAEMVRMFTEAFEKINVNFGIVFRELFGGGEAHLSLTDPENVLTCGIEISAAPPGKMIKNLSLLSGGEQAVIAIALLFALVRVNPSPFCIFDEIEAALDEVNVARVAQYVKRVAARMQIIMITHRRGTMEIADTLYGVTMPRRGISKVFALEDPAERENVLEQPS